MRPQIAGLQGLIANPDPRRGLAVPGSGGLRGYSPPLSRALQAWRPTQTASRSC